MLYYAIMKSTQTPIQLLDHEWDAVKTFIKENEGLSATMNHVLKREKGWSYRSPYYSHPVYIDFWNDSAKSMFLLSYSHLIAKSLKLYSKNNG